MTHIRKEYWTDSKGIRHEMEVSVHPAPKGDTLWDFVWLFAALCGIVLTVSGIFAIIIWMLIGWGNLLRAGLCS